MNNLNRRIGFSTVRPTKSGWYDAIWEPGELPTRVYLTVTEYGIVWGWDEDDDPESIDQGLAYDPDTISYRKADGPEMTNHQP